MVSTSGVRLHAEAGVVLDGTGFNGIGISVRGASADSPVTSVEVSGFEVRNFESGIMVEFAVNAAIHRNEVHLNVDKVPPIVLGDGIGIQLFETRLSEVSQNLVHGNGDTGIFLRAGAAQNSVRANRIIGNGTQRMTSLNGAGIAFTGANTHYNRVSENEVIGNYGRGIRLTRPVGTAPLTGNLIEQNRVHDNYRSGISIMTAAVNNIVQHNDARWNNISGLPPCYQCNLFEMVVGTNTWLRNLGTSNLTDACAQ